MDDRELAKLLTQAGEDPDAFVGTSSQMNADGTVTVTGRRGSVTAIAQTAFRSGAWSVKRVGNTWYAWSTNAPIVDTESRQVRRSTPSKKKTTGINYVVVFDSNLLSNVIIYGQPPPQNYTFIENLFLGCLPSKNKRIYTFSDNPGEGIPPRGTTSLEIINFLRTKFTVQEVTISQLKNVNSVFYWPFTQVDLINKPNPFIDVSQATINTVKDIAKKYGVVLQGENQESFNPINHYLMDKFYKPFHSKYNFTFTNGLTYSLAFGLTAPYRWDEINKYGKLLFKGIEKQDVRTSLSAGIPIDIIPSKERLAVFEHQENKYVGVVGWESKIS